MPNMYETPKCCKDAQGGGVYWMVSWYDGPKKDGWSVKIRNGIEDWKNVNYCPYCGAQLKSKED